MDFRGRLKEGSWMIGLMRCGWTKMHPHEAADEGDAADSGDETGHNRMGNGRMGNTAGWGVAV